MKRIGKAYKGILDRIPASPSVNKRYTFDLDSTQLSMLLSNASLLVDEILGADNETGFWFWADYVNPAYQRGTAQEFANLAQQSAVYAAGQESVSTILLSEPYRRRLILVRARTFEEMKNLSASVKADMARILTDGLGRGQNPLEIAKRLTEQTGIESRRANRIAGRRLPPRCAVRASTKTTKPENDMASVQSRCTYQRSARRPEAPMPRVTPICIPQKSSGSGGLRMQTA